MRPTDLDDLLRRLVRDELHRSIAIPTRRFGRPAFVSVTVGIVGPDRAQREPLQWIAVDAATSELLAFALTAAITPLPSWRPPSMAPSLATALDPMEVQAAMRDLWVPVRDGFVAGTEVPAQDRRRVGKMLRASVPTTIQAWIFECCSDFLDWLGGDDMSA